MIVNKKGKALIWGIVAAVILAILLWFVFSGKTNTIAEIKNSNYVGKTVKISGVVESTIKLGSLSGYILKDDTDKIAVSSQTLPKEGDTITVKGTLIRDTLLGYYVKAD